MARYIHTTQLGKVLVSLELPTPTFLTKVVHLPEEPVLSEQDLITPQR